MWLTQEYGQNYKHSFQTAQALYEGKTLGHSVAVYETDTLGKTLVVDENICFSELDAFAVAEMAIHVPMCSHKNPLDVALLQVSVPLAYEMLKYNNISTTWVAEDGALLDVQKNNFDVYEEVFSALEQKNSSSIDYVRSATDESLDIVISQSKVDGDFGAFVAHIARALRKDGLAVFELTSNMMDISALKEPMQELGKSFKIVMPFQVESPSAIGGVKTFVLASKEYHPTADFILQRADLIDGLKFYNCDVHPAAFAMPNYIRTTLRGIAKN